MHRQHVVSRSEGQRARVAKNKPGIAKVHVAVGDEGAEPTENPQALCIISIDPTIALQFYCETPPIDAAMAEVGSIERSQ